MRIGFLVPTDGEARVIPVLNKHLTCAGYGAGKVAACAAAAELIFHKHCDTIIIWGAAGAMSKRVHVNDIVVGAQVAYRDFNIAPLCGSTGVGWVQGFAENVFVELDKNLRAMLLKQLKKTFPGRNVMEGVICSGDQFMQLKPDDPHNRVESNSDAVDMESVAVAHFCQALNKNIKVGIIRVISDNADGNAGIDFCAFLDSFAEMSEKTYELRRGLLDEEDDSHFILNAIEDFQDFPVKGVLFKDIWGIFYDPEIFDAVCHKLYDLFHIENAGAKIDKIVGIESRGFIFGFEMAKMFNVPFVPLRKKNKLPGEVVSDTYITEYSQSCLEAQKAAFSPGENILVVDDIIATGGSLLAAKNVIQKCGAKCQYALALGQISGLNGVEILKEHGISAVRLFDL